MQRITSLTKHYPLATFFVLAFVLTSPINQLIEIINPTTLLSTLLVLPIALLALGPFAAALIVSAIIGGKTEVVALLRKLFIWRVGLRWYVVALFLLPTLHLVTIYLTVLLGAPAPTAVSFGTVSGLLQLLPYAWSFPGHPP